LGNFLAQVLNRCLLFSQGLAHGILTFGGFSRIGTEGRQSEDILRPHHTAADRQQQKQP